MARSTGKAAVFFILLTALSACSGEETGFCGPGDSGAAELCWCEPAGCEHGRRVQVVEVIDGDTVKLEDGTKVRLLGINAPEMPHGTDDPNLDQETCLGPVAGDFLATVLEGETACMIFPSGSEEKDRYGRTLAYLYLDGMNLSALMVSTGHACVYDAFKEPTCHEGLLDLELSAREELAGIWGLCARLHGDPCALSD